MGLSGITQALLLGGFLCHRQLEMASPDSVEHGKRRDDRRERTRERMLTAAISLLRREGLSAVSVSRVAKEVGVHPSLFYAHFKNIDAFLAAAAQRVIETLAPVDRELRRELMKRAVTDRRQLARYFEHAFERWLEQRAFVELLLAHGWIARRWARRCALRCRGCVKT